MTDECSKIPQSKQRGNSHPPKTSLCTNKHTPYDLLVLDGTKTGLSLPAFHIYKGTLSIFWRSYPTCTSGQRCPSTVYYQSSWRNRTRIRQRIFQLKDLFFMVTSLIWTVQKNECKHPIYILADLHCYTNRSERLRKAFVRFLMIYRSVCM